jgi:hypothetical protein
MASKKDWMYFVETAALYLASKACTSRAGGQGSLSSWGGKGEWPRKKTGVDRMMSEPRAGRASFMNAGFLFFMLILPPF